MIRLENVNKYFNKRKKNEIHVISDTTIAFPKQGLIALLGPSGSGKTTLLNTIGGLDRINSGKIYVDDERISKRRAGKIDKIRNAKIGYIFQNYNLIDNKTVFENVAIVLRMIGIKNKKEINKRVEYALDLVGMYRYRNRFADMLSGGERQRVGIARAIVKNPSIIIADEPTGNLDSRNTIEVMNIIKSISKEKLVILVTHEEQLAEFYADRTVKLKDGKVVSDEENVQDRKLDYRMDHRIYLKDMTNHETLQKDDCKIDIYTDKNEDIELNVVVRGGNIYLQCLSDNKHIEIVDQHSAIEVIDDHYREMTKEEQEKYNFNPDKLGKEGDGRHASIINVFTAIANGFRTLRDYSILKKILLAGFFVSAIFIVYSISNIAGVTNIDDSKFVNDNKDYLRIKTNKVAVKDYLQYEKENSVEYLLPGNGKASFKFPYNEYLQTYGRSTTLSGSLSSSEPLSNEDLVAGRMPEKKNEIIVDKLVYSKMKEIDNSVILAGISSAEDLLGKYVELKYTPDFFIVGITDKKSPCIYAHPKQFINIMANSREGGGGEEYMEEEMMDESAESQGGSELVDVKLMKDKFKLAKGRIPKKEYEVLVNKQNEEEMKLNKEIPEKVNGKKLLVVGYYTPISDDIDHRLVTKGTIKRNLIATSKNITVCPTNKEDTTAALEEMGLNVLDIYQYDKDKYTKEIWPMIKSTVIMAVIIIIVSFIEILLIMRASFLSRIKEIGTLRAIGVKKSDIYKIFAGEIVAITTLASLPGYIFMTYIVDKLTNIPYLKESFMINLNLFVMGIAGILIFNLIVGLLPVFSTMRKTPAAILARTDIQ